MVDGARTRGLQVHGLVLLPSELRPPCPWPGSNRRLPLYKSGALSTELRGRVTTAVPVGRDIEPLRLEHPTNPGHLVTVTVGVLEAGGGHDKPDDVVEWANALWLCGKGRLSYRRSAD